MSKRVQIDIEKECIPSVYADFKGVKRNLVSMWIERGKIQTRKIESLKLTLIKIPAEEREAFRIYLKKRGVYSQKRGWTK